MSRLTTISGRDILIISILLLVVPIVLLLIASQIWTKVDTFFTQNWLDVLRDLIAIVGFVLTIWGLAVTFDQARQAREQAREAKTSAEQARVAAEEATERVRESVAKVDTVRTLESASALIERIYDYQSRESWDRVPEFYNNVRNLLAEVQGEASALEEDDKKYVLDAASELRSIELSIQKRRYQGIVIDDMPEMNQVITDHRSKFITMKIDLGRRERA